MTFFADMTREGLAFLFFVLGACSMALLLFIIGELWAFSEAAAARWRK